MYDMNTPVSKMEYLKIIEIIDELKQGKPIQYILGETEFYNCRIILSPATIIPRQETEELADIIIKENIGYKGQILDIGSGSGCIAIALAKNMPDASIFGIDFSAEAIEIAKHNAAINNVKIDFINEDIFKPSKIFSINAGIIVSNPPYVRNSEKAFMHRNVLDYEPATALFVDDANPLVFYETILEIAVKILQVGGKIYFEINEALGSEMKKLLKRFEYTDIELINDINGKERFIKGVKNG
jgi:release factor glutamine methyltransferase